MVESDYTLPKVYEIAFWKAHSGPLVSIQHVGIWGGRELVLTASTDCNVSVWTLKGAHIGIFGQMATWSLINSNNWLDTKEHPVDRFNKQSHGGGRSGRGRGGVTSDGVEVGGRENAGGEINGKNDDDNISSSSESDNEGEGKDEFKKYR